MDYNIKIEEGKHKYGYMKGIVDRFNWYALVHKEQIEYGIDPMNLESGWGRITRLCVYKDVIEFGGNPYAPSRNVRRYIYANYKREWDILSKNHIHMVKELIGYLERIYSLKLVK